VKAIILSEDGQKKILDEAEKNLPKLTDLDSFKRGDYVEAQREITRLRAEWLEKYFGDS